MDVFDELDGVRCFCGRRKGSGKSFCWTCWCKLRAGLKRRLYESIGYPEAVTEAKKFLAARSMETHA